MPTSLTLVGCGRKNIFNGTQYINGGWREGLMRELQSLVDFNSNLNFGELAPYTNKVGKRFGEFNFACGCGQIHSIIKIKNSNPMNPTVWSDGRTHSPKVSPVVSEQNRILYYCDKGFFTMVSLTSTLFRNTVTAEFFIKQEIIDSAENGFGLCISTRDFFLDFNIYRKDKVPTKRLKTWQELEQRLLERGHDSLKPMPTYNPELENIIFKCPCDEKGHSIVGHRGDFAFNQTHGGFHVAALRTKDSDRLLTLCSNGFYCFFHIRPTLPIEWFFKCETVRVEGLSVPILPQEAENSMLHADIIKHIRFLHSMARNYF